MTSGTSPRPVESLLLFDDGRRDTVDGFNGFLDLLSFFSQNFQIVAVKFDRDLSGDPRQLWMISQPTGLTRIQNEGLLPR